MPRPPQYATSFFVREAGDLTFFETLLVFVGKVRRAQRGCAPPGPPTAHNLHA